MKLYGCILCILLTGKMIYSQPSASLDASRIHLPNGWSLTPVGTSLPLGDLPLNISVSASKKYLAVTNNGQSTQAIQLLSVLTKKVLHEVVIPKSWYGLKFSAGDKFLYASGGNDNMILKYSVRNDQLKLTDSIILGDRWPVKISPAGIEIDESKNLMFVTTKEDNSLYVIQLTTKKILQKIALGAEAFTCLLSPDKKDLYISSWGGKKILVYNISRKALTGEIATGDHPNDMCLSRNSKFLFLANANDNSVSIIDLRNRKVLETVNAALYPDAPDGSTTNAVALSPDDKTLYVANADNNCLAVFDVTRPGSSKSKGFIPVGWYPTAVKVIGNKIYVANAKGFTSKPNPLAPDPIHDEGQAFHRGDTSKKLESQYIGGLFKGTLSIIDVPSDKLLASYSQAVYANTPYSKDRELISAGEEGNPIPQKVGDPSPIRHVFYIVKENRTYDQVLSDIPGGNGDTSLLLFGEKITPNQHALAKEFVLLDNFYVDGEVSADGHNWSMGGYANDYLEKTWPTGYGSRGGEYEGEGTRPIANIRDGYIWDQASRAGVSYRTYGEFIDKNNNPSIPVLRDHYCKQYTQWDQTVRDTTRAGQWKRDFDSLIAINQLPQLNTLRIINDHTEGLKLGRPSPFAHVADNDLAVGMFMDYLSKSPIWKESVVFILEDDAQDGPDHVDAHRSIAFVAGGYVKRKFVDHTMYSTSSVLRTIELILGMPPMTQYDAAATSMWRCFSKTPDASPFNHLPAGYDLNEKNTALNEWQRKSEQFDFTQEDRIPDREFTEVIWKAVKGVNAIVPAPKRSAFVRVGEEKDEDD